MPPTIDCEGELLLLPLLPLLPLSLFLLPSILPPPVPPVFLLLLLLRSSEATNEALLVGGRGSQLGSAQVLGSRGTAKTSLPLTWSEMVVRRCQNGECVLVFECVSFFVSNVNSNLERRFS
jgi:hypothetical protein